MRIRKAARHRQSQVQSDDWRSANPLPSDKLSDLGQHLPACYDRLIEEPLPEQLAGFITPAKAPAATAKETLIDINSAGQQELDVLPQIGSARAEAIIKGRPYRSKNDLRENKIIPEEAYNAIKEKVVARQKS